MSQGFFGQAVIAADAPALAHFDFVEPSGGPWQVDRSTEGLGGIAFIRREGGALYQIQLSENAVLGPEVRTATAAWVADDFRASERQGMQELGAGEYRMRDVVMGEETLGGKLFYFMSYVTEASNHYQRARLYLYFPYPEANEYFLTALYSEMARRRSDLEASHEADFRQLLATVAHRPGSAALPVGSAASPRAAGAAEAAAAPAPAPGFMRDFVVVHAMTQSALPRDQLHVKCQVKVDEGYVSLIETPETGVGWVALTSRRFSDPGKNLLTRGQMPGERGGVTMDWGYVLDRNRDGRVDYLAFLYGTACVAPEKCEEPLPSVTGGTLTRELIEVITRNIRLVFWHIADENHDGRTDAAAVPLVTVANGWIEGWLVTRDADFDHSFEECRHYTGPLRTDVGPCEGSPAGYTVPGKQSGGLRQVPPSDEPFLQTINRAVQECKLSEGSLRSLPAVGTPP
jgi:hypothetical protein